MSNLIHTTKCLFCAFKIDEQEFEPDGSALTGQVPQRLTDFNVKLLSHIQRGATFEQQEIDKALKHFHKHGGPPPDESKAKHRDAWTNFLRMNAFAQGTAILAAFQTTDPGIQILKEAARSGLHESTRKYYFTDEHLLQNIQQLDLDQSTQAKVLEVMKAMRDALEEKGVCAPKFEQPARVIA